MNRYLVLFFLICTYLPCSPLQATVFFESSRLQKAINLSQPCIGYLELEDAIISSRAFKQKLSYLIEHPLIVGIVLTINSGGGTVTAAWEIYDALMKANAKKPIISYIEEVCASGAYLAACATSSILSNEMARVGSIGVVQTIEKVEPSTFKRDGVKGTLTIHRFKKGKYKQLGSAYDPITDEERELLEQEIDMLHHRFCSDVARNRGLTEEAVAAQESLTFTGAEALELGLIDQIGDFDDALIALSNELAYRGIGMRGSAYSAQELKESLIYVPSDLVSLAPQQPSDSNYEIDAPVKIPYLSCSSKLYLNF